MRLPRLPTREALLRRAPKAAGFAFGVAVCLVGAMLVTVIYQGHGYFVSPTPADVVYPNL
ncbi:hypothetical protein [Anianabacter salinae]|uniref:hypothetical protein n=1 Tax=Anianabacter salinae TaxID=2851023 RepID=UPI00225E4640|nr:hypothetical protein [Anianabacter salinae]MBV0911875.1 hypothetical protein [Anianabacter salinae]